MWTVLWPHQLKHTARRLQFDLKFLTDSIMEAFDSFNEVPDITNVEKQQIRKWVKSEDAITLQQLEDKFTEITAQKREKYLYTSCYCCHIRGCSFCVPKSKGSNKKKTKTVEHTKDAILELPTDTPFLFNTPQSPPAQTVVHISPTRIRCTQLTAYQSQEASGSNHQLAERGRNFSVDSFNCYVRP
ncbi:hypothetical protein TSAR_008431 [Trichomalopsis sarcophagae]|uniref:Uncharacterized protein n=1 Tax=Trichomalopsis sarcophagae TaxID=543379 RepID=A0A232EEV8_9HYME|nr:hypothetical protein TSAR_008431 [Trichomalopsis sarcophagae]